MAKLSFDLVRQKFTAHKLRERIMDLGAITWHVQHSKYVFVQHD